MKRPGAEPGQRDGRPAWRRLGAGAVLAALATTAAADPRPAGVRLSEDGRTASVTLDVLTYNLEGVPRRSGRKAALREIGARLDAARRSGDAPDLILFQEAFSRDARAVVRAAGYPATAAGPRRGQRRELPAEPGRRGHKWAKGEWGVKLVGSGLAVASVHPIRVSAAEPFSGRACAGFDCLSNKGGLFARIDIPGAPAGIDIFNTHMNAQGASRVKLRRHLRVHNAQVLELAEFMRRWRDPANPAILGGDFNMRGSEARFDFFQAAQSLELVHRRCLEAPRACDVRVSWDGDAPWMDTQDLQLFSAGGRIHIRPVRVEAMFDGRPGSPRLSDHDGLRVTYELSWRVE